MGCVLVCLGGVDDELNAVVGRVRDERGVRPPLVAARVVDALRNVGDRLHVGAWASQEDERDGSCGCGLGEKGQ